MLPPFVKKFDFRGVYDKDIKDQDAFYLALAIYNVFSPKKVLVGWDTRVASKNLAMNFLQALKSRDVEIHYLEQCPIDYVTAGAHDFDFDFAVMFTGSHNPWNWSGLLMHTKGGASVEGELVTSIVNEYNALLQESYVSPDIDLSSFKNFQEPLEDTYKKKILSLVPLDQIQAMDVVVDIGDGSGSKSLDVLERLLPQVTFHRLNDRGLYDADTPHTADPSNKENMQQVMDAMKNGQYSCGFAFDSDADRVLAVDETGAYINGSQYGSAMLDAFTHLQNPMKTFGYAVECGPAMYNTVVDLHKEGKTDVVAKACPVGRSILRRMVRENEIDMGVENVGHFYIKDFFMTDSGAFSLAVLLFWISKHGKLSSLEEKHPDGQRGHFSLPLAENQEEELQRVIDEINPHFENKHQRKIEVDGIRYEFFEGEYLQSWYAMRQSGYEKIEKYYFGSRNDEDFTFLKEKIKKG